MINMTLNPHVPIGPQCTFSHFATVKRVREQLPSGLKDAQSRRNHRHPGSSGTKESQNAMHRRAYHTTTVTRIMTRVLNSSGLVHHENKWMTVPNYGVCSRVTGISGNILAPTKQVLWRPLSPAEKKPTFSFLIGIPLNCPVPFIKHPLRGHREDTKYFPNVAFS